MTTPIADFIARYVRSDAARLHMPGHKGRGLAENAPDITEIDGADALYEAGGIIAESERNAASLDRKSTRLNSSHPTTSRMPSSA